MPLALQVRIWQEEMHDSDVAGMVCILQLENLMTAFAAQAKTKLS